MDQKQAFISGEGDNWFNRNKGAISLEGDPVIHAVELIIGSAKEKIASILEVGCGTGLRLDYLREKFNLDPKGIDPSHLSVDEAKGKGIDAKVGTADRLLWNDKSIDILVFGFCLYLCDRDDLFKIACEADRVVNKPGWIIILDFFSKSNQIVPYKHSQGLNSYKMDYTNLFTWHGHYTLFYKYVMDHGSRNRFCDDPNEWMSIAILRRT